MAQKIGDIFSLKLDDEKYCYGQIINKKGKSIYVSIFSSLYSEDNIDLDKVRDDKVIIVAQTFPALIKHGLWKVVGNSGVRFDKTLFPSYKIETNDGTGLVEFGSHEVVQMLNAEESTRYKYEKFYSPIIVHKAAQSFHEVIPLTNDLKALYV